MTSKQRRFVEEYLVDLNATPAAIRAGYIRRTAYSIGEENLRKPEIREAIDMAKKERSSRTKVTAEQVVQELAVIAFSATTDLFDWSSGTQKMKSIRSVGPRALVAIKSVEADERGVRVTTYDKLRALELLGKHLAIFSPDQASQDLLKAKAEDQLHARVMDLVRMHVDVGAKTDADESS